MSVVHAKGSAKQAVERPVTQPSYTEGPPQAALDLVRALARAAARQDHAREELGAASGGKVQNDCGGVQRAHTIQDGSSRPRRPGGSCNLRGV